MATKKKGTFKPKTEKDIAKVMPYKGDELEQIKAMMRIKARSEGTAKKEEFKPPPIKKEEFKTLPPGTQGA